MPATVLYVFEMKMKLSSLITYAWKMWRRHNARISHDCRFGLSQLQLTFRWWHCLYCTETTGEIDPEDSLMTHLYHPHHVLLLKHQVFTGLKEIFQVKHPVSGDRAIALITRLKSTLAHDVVYHAHEQTHTNHCFCVLVCCKLMISLSMKLPIV